MLSLPNSTSDQMELTEPLFLTTPHWGKQDDPWHIKQDLWTLKKSNLRKAHWTTTLCLDLWPRQNLITRGVLPASCLYSTLFWSVADIHFHFLELMIRREQELLVRNLHQSKSILDYDYKLHGKKIEAYRHIWAPSC